MGDTQRIRFNGAPGWHLSGAELELPAHLDMDLATARLRVSGDGRVFVGPKLVPSARVIALPVALRPQPNTGPGGEVKPRRGRARVGAATGAPAASAADAAAKPRRRRTTRKTPAAPAAVAPALVPEFGAPPV